MTFAIDSIDGVLAAENNMSAFAAKWIAAHAAFQFVKHHTFDVGDGEVLNGLDLGVYGNIMGIS